MAHMKRFAAIPMSKSMRDMCKEEDYAFLNKQKSEEVDKTPKESTCRESEWQQKQEERHRRRLDREQQEKERQCELEKQRRVQYDALGASLAINALEKEEQWKSHVAALASERESVRGRLHRLREFRDFQKRVLMQDLDLVPDERLTHLLMRL